MFRKTNCKTATCSSTHAQRKSSAIACHQHPQGLQATSDNEPRGTGRKIMYHKSEVQTASVQVGLRPTLSTTSVTRTTTTKSALVIALSNSTSPHNASLSQLTLSPLSPLFSYASSIEEREIHIQPGLEKKGLSTFLAWLCFAESENSRDWGIWEEIGILFVVVLAVMAICTSEGLLSRVPTQLILALLLCLGERLPDVSTWDTRNRALGQRVAKC